MIWSFSELVIKTKSGFLKQDGVHKNLIEENELGRKSLKAGGNPGSDKEGS